MNDLEYLSIIILNYNSLNDTFTCIEHIKKFQSKMHIIVVDNQSPDDSYKELLEKYKCDEEVCVIQSDKNGGYSYGNNFGIRYAEREFGSSIIGIMNPDIVVDDYSVFTAMCDALDTYPKLAIVGASTLSPDGSYNPNNSGWSIPTGWQLVKWHFLKNSRKKEKPQWVSISEQIAQVECVAGCFFLAKADVLKEIGYLDENVFLYHEENILGIKCKKKGYVEGVILDKYYIHNHRQKKGEVIPFKKKINATANVYKSTGYLLRTYYSKAYLPVLFGVELMNKIYLFIAYVRNSLKRVGGEI